MAGKSGGASRKGAGLQHLAGSAPLLPPLPSAEDPEVQEVPSSPYALDKAFAQYRFPMLKDRQMPTADGHIRQPLQMSYCGFDFMLAALGCFTIRDLHCIHQRSRLHPDSSIFNELCSQCTADVCALKVRFPFDSPHSCGCIQAVQHECIQLGLHGSSSNYGDKAYGRAAMVMSQLGVASDPLAASFLLEELARPVPSGMVTCFLSYATKKHTINNIKIQKFHWHPCLRGPCMGAK